MNYSMVIQNLQGYDSRAHASSSIHLTWSASGLVAVGSVPLCFLACSGAEINLTLFG